MASEVLLPASPAEAVAAFGDGRGVTVVGGGTIVMPEINYGRLTPDKVVLLAGAGLSGVARGDGVVRIGATTPVAALEGGDEPLASAARHVADPEIRAQATVAGNLCAPPGDVPRGDLQAPLVALAARVRSLGPGGERTQPVEEFLAGEGSGRLVVEVEYDDVRRTAAHAAVRRPHSHHYTILCVAAVHEEGVTRVAVAGAGPVAVRARSVEDALARGEAPPAACQRVVDDVEETLQDDALASAWYRRRVLPTVVARALASLGAGEGRD